MVIYDALKVSIHKNMVLLFKMKLFNQIRGGTSADSQCYCITSNDCSLQQLKGQLWQFIMIVA